MERHVTLMEEKQVILRRQQEKINRLMTTQVGGCTGEMTDGQRNG